MPHNKTASPKTPDRFAARKFPNTDTKTRHPDTITKRNGYATTKQTQQNAMKNRSSKEAEHQPARKEPGVMNKTIQQTHETKIGK